MGPFIQGKLFVMKKTHKTKVLSQKTDLSAPVKRFSVTRMRNIQSIDPLGRCFL